MPDEEGKPLTPTEVLKKHVEGGGFENDDAVLEAAGRAFFPEKVDPPAPTVVERIPEGYVKDEEAFAYQEKMRRRDAEAVRERMRQTLPPEDAAAANSDFSAFNFEFDRVAEAMRQEKEQTEAREAAARAKIEAHKNAYRKIMREDPDPAKRAAAEATYFRKFVQGGGE